MLCGFWEEKHYSVLPPSITAPSEKRADSAFLRVCSAALWHSMGSRLKKVGNCWRVRTGQDQIGEKMWKKKRSPTLKSKHWLGGKKKKKKSLLIACCSWETIFVAKIVRTDRNHGPTISGRKLGFFFIFYSGTSISKEGLLLVRDTLIMDHHALF